MVIALASDAPLYFLNAFVESVTYGGDDWYRFIVYRRVHFAMQVLLLGCAVFPWILYKREQVSAERPLAREESQ